MRRAVAYSFAAEFGTLLSMIGCFKLAADLWGVEGFGQWALVRRVVAFFVPLVTCGLEIAIPRYVAYRRRSGSGLTEGDYMAGGTIFVAGSLAAISVILLGGRETAAQVLFGSAADAHLVAPLITMVVGCGLFIPAYAYLRGTMQIMKANLVYLLMFGVVPLVALGAFSSSPTDALLALGTISTALSLVYLAWLFGRFHLRSAHPIQAGNVLIRFGATRMYAAFGLMALATVPPVIVAQVVGLAQAGYVVFALTIIALTGSAAAPIGVSLLPQVAELAAQGRVASLEVPLRRFHRLLLAAWIACVAIVWVAAPLIVHTFFGAEAQSAVLLLRVASLGAAPYAYFICVRSVVDASVERGINARIVGMAVAVFMVIAIAGILLGGPDSSSLVVVLAYVAGSVAMAALSWKAVRDIMVRARLAAASGSALA